MDRGVGIFQISRNHFKIQKHHCSDARQISYLESGHIRHYDTKKIVAWTAKPPRVVHLPLYKLHKFEPGLTSYLT